MAKYFENEKLDNLWNRLIDATIHHVVKNNDSNSSNEEWGPVTTIGFDVFKGCIYLETDDGYDYYIHSEDGIDFSIKNYKGVEVMSGYGLNSESLRTLENGVYTVVCTSYGMSSNYELVGKTASLIIGNQTVLENYGIKGIHDALLSVFNLQHEHVPTKIADYLCGISQAARTNANRVNNTWYLETASHCKDDNFVFDYDLGTISLSNTSNIDTVSIYNSTSDEFVGKITKSGFYLSNLDIVYGKDTGYYLSYGTTTHKLKYGRAIYDLEEIVEMLEEVYTPIPEIILDEYGVLHLPYNFTSYEFVEIDIHWITNANSDVITKRTMVGCSSEIDLSQYMVKGEIYYVYYSLIGPDTGSKHGTSNRITFISNTGANAIYTKCTLSSALTAKTVRQNMPDYNTFSFILLDEYGDEIPGFNVDNVDSGIWRFGIMEDSSTSPLIQGNKYRVKVCCHNGYLEDGFYIYSDLDTFVPCNFNAYMEEQNVLCVTADVDHLIKSITIDSDRDVNIDMVFSENFNNSTYATINFENHIDIEKDMNDVYITVEIACGAKDADGVYHDSVERIFMTVDLVAQSRTYWLGGDNSVIILGDDEKPMIDIYEEWCYYMPSCRNDCGSKFYISSSYPDMSFECPHCHGTEINFIDTDMGSPSVVFYGMPKNYFYKDSMFSPGWSTDGEIGDSYLEAQYWRCTFCASKHYPFYTGGEFIPGNIDSCCRCGHWQF